MAVDPKKKNLQKITRQNVLESLKDLGGGVADQTTDLLKSTSEDFFRELIGLQAPKKKYSGDLEKGQSLEVNDVFKGKVEENKKLKAQITLERTLSSEEQRRTQEKSNELKVQLHALINEIGKLAKSTQGLAQEAEIAMIEAPADPGVYHVLFFEKVLEFVRSFRKKIEESTTWLQSSNKRAEKKNYWAMYKKKGSSFLLAPDHYLQRSAG